MLQGRFVQSPGSVMVAVEGAVLPRHHVMVVPHPLVEVAGVDLTLMIVAMCAESVVTTRMIVQDLDVVVEVLGVVAGRTLVPDLVLVIIVVVHTAEAQVHEEVVIVHRRGGHEAMIKLFSSSRTLKNICEQMI
jgi:hypothetical protein